MGGLDRDHTRLAMVKSKACRDMASLIGATFSMGPVPDITSNLAATIEFDTWKPRHRPVRLAGSIVVSIGIWVRSTYCWVSVDALVLREDLAFGGAWHPRFGAC